MTLNIKSNGLGGAMVHSIKPREQSGRDSFSRFRAQTRSATIASLSILEGKEIDWIYCDFQDDFVVRYRIEGEISYKFYQVKTKSKQNESWTISELTGINTRKKDENQDLVKLKESFIGKLLLQTLMFEESCKYIVFQTNINNDNNVESFFEDILNGNFDNKYVQLFLNNFNCIFSGELNGIIDNEGIKNKLKKLIAEVDVEYLKDKHELFEPLVRSRIYDYSEVDLNYSECKELILKLLSLVENKSSGVIKDINENSVNELAGISIKNLLPIMSITYDAYQILLNGGDSNAIKSVSIIQRALEGSGATEETIKYCSKWKSEWDIWLRNTRHNVSEFELEILISEIRRILNEAVKFGNYIKIIDLKKPLTSYYAEVVQDGNKLGLSEDLLLGGVFSEFVKSKV